MLEALIARQAKENQKLSAGKGCQKSDKVNPIDTKKELAKIAGVSHDTIARLAERQVAGHNDPAPDKDRHPARGSPPRAWGRGL